MNALSDQGKLKEENAFSVSSFLTQVNVVLSSQGCRVQGEVTKINEGYSTAIYFNIKDENEDALLNCIIWRRTYEYNGVDLKEGDKIIVTGTPEVYPPRGSFSFKVQTIEYAGEGALKKAYEELKEKLTREGIFEEERKRSLPLYPQKIGVITSNRGVVIQDFSSNLGRYGFKVRMVDSRVEGKDAMHDILASIRTFEKEDIEVLVMMRGGGSWESLQPFNNESIVRAVTKFKCPVLTGIGHDVDVTLVEMAADVGESTPTAVAEALNESWDDLHASLESAERRIVGAFQQSLFAIHEALNVDANKTQSFFRSLERRLSAAHNNFQRIVGQMSVSVRNERNNISHASHQIVDLFDTHIDDAEGSFSRFASGILQAQRSYIRAVSENIIAAEKGIRIADPGRNLRLGYSLSYSGGKLVRSISDVVEGDILETHVSDGKLESRIRELK